MSIQRAYVNCERCYKIAERKGYKNFNESIEDDQLFTARNEAMKALEETIITFHEYPQVFGKEKFFADMSIVHALITCKSCNYSKPEIKEIIGEAADN
jgi:hypothetical protein